MRIPNLAISASFPAHVAFRTHIKAKSIELPCPLPPDDPDVIQEDPVQAEAVVYLVDEANIAGALGYHDLNNAEVPVGFVFTDLGDWTVTFSHEVLELIVDPTVNILVPGPDPRAPNDPNAWLLHTYEVCDAVERTEYVIDGIALSNFVTPMYFAEGDAPGSLDLDVIFVQDEALASTELLQVIFEPTRGCGGRPIAS